jgi:hypothetical protein
VIDWSALSSRTQQEPHLTSLQASAEPPCGHDWLAACGVEIYQEPVAVPCVLIPVRRTGKEARPSKSTVSSVKPGSTKAFEKLHRSQDRWRTTSKSDADRAAKNVTALLNKLSTANMVKLVEQFVTFVLQASIIGRAAELLFEKAISEPGFAYVYSKFVLFLAAAFARRATESHSDAESFDASIRRKLTENEPELFVDFDRKRALGIAKLVAELYNVGFSRADEMHERVFGMFSVIDQEKPDEHHVELLCKFIGALGKNLEAADADAIARYFEVMTMIMNNPQMTPRARFMIMDLVELRANGWSADFIKKPTQPHAQSSTTTLALTDALPAHSTKAPSASDTATAKPVLTPDQLDKRTTSLLNEFLASQDVAEAVASLGELGSHEMLSTIVFKSITLALDRKPADRALVVSMLTTAGETAVLSPAHLENGFTNVLELIEDLSIDIPHASAMLTSMLGGVVAKRLLPLSFLDKALPFFPPNELPSLRIVEVLAAVQKVAGNDALKQIYAESSDRWSIRQYLKGEEVAAAPLLQLILL